GAQRPIRREVLAAGEELAFILRPRLGVAALPGWIDLEEGELGEGPVRGVARHRRDVSARGVPGRGAGCTAGRRTSILLSARRDGGARRWRGGPRRSQRGRAHRGSERALRQLARNPPYRWKTRQTRGLSWAHGHPGQCPRPPSAYREPPGPRPPRRDRCSSTQPQP